MTKTVFCLMGPTASGKTGLASELVQHFPFEIISVDSAMIYRGMDIGTAKPTKEELAKAPHFLIDIKEPNQSYSAAEFCTDAVRLCDEIIKRGNIPLLVGGTMMYFNALQNGLSSLPEADEAIRRSLEDEAALRGWEALHSQLMEVDPQTAARVHANDTQRIQRALEVYHLTGKSLSSFLADQVHQSPYHFVSLVLFPEQRSWLHERIAQRFDLMIKEGFIDEVIKLQKQWGLTMSFPSMRCVGYRQVLEHLQGQWDYATMREKGIAATRQLAKRQLTWLRHWERAMYFDSQTSTFNADILAKIREILDNTDT
ncbi:tRNA (adenosine(37)-N6)-dimethylallyltransferase MiaA [Legionella waltersii]|uniref:tRNA dimethylallyltransferase n=1 Tax=Legionella waltersii TaxID=66969 RepID=A0A0W1AD91_9GAMM|nr:tRNA (adenosine(37)-N6)-dimethylallyltransferase MiaA [Legionella waltersii]KTD79293.1 tRNA delta(2)-isopentenylpyrophosphate transferase [Legionella waltersii]SNV12930.1 tRNA delta(2)-isopentenylpyrophosphate transferase [Legionella waltersii]